MRHAEQHFLRRRAPGQRPPRLRNFNIAHAFRLVAQGLHRIHPVPPPPLAMDGRRPGRDDFIGLARLALAAAAVFLHHGMQIIHGVQVDVFQFPGLRFDVPRHREIHHEHRPPLAPPQGLLDGPLAEDGQLAAGGTNHDVRGGELFRDVRQQHRLRAEAPRQFPGAAQSAAGDGDARHAGIRQMPGDEVDGFPGAHQQGSGPGQIREDAPGELHRCVSHRHRVLADGGVGAHPFSDREGARE